MSFHNHLNGLIKDDAVSYVNIVEENPEQVREVALEALVHSLVTLSGLQDPSSYYNFSPNTEFCLFSNDWKMVDHAQKFYTTKYSGKVPTLSPNYGWLLDSGKNIVLQHGSVWFNGPKSCMYGTVWYSYTVHDLWHYYSTVLLHIHTKFGKNGRAV